MRCIPNANCTVSQAKELLPAWTEFLLVRCVNLAKVQFGSTAWFNDEIVANVISRLQRKRKNKDLNLILIREFKIMRIQIVPL